MKKQVKMSGYNANDLSEMVKSLAHPERLQILSLMYKHSKEKLNVKMIFEFLELEQPIVSRHLGIMKKAGLLNKKTEGNRSYYSVNLNNKLCICMKQMLDA